MKEKIKQLLAPRAILLLAGCALGINFLLELLGNRSLVSALKALVCRPHFFLLNALILAVTFSISEFFRHRTFVMSLISFVWLGLGIANCVLMTIRNSPLCGSDFYILTTGISIITVYLSTLQLILIILAILLAIGGLIVLYRKMPKKPISPLSALCHTSFLVLFLLTFTLSVKASGCVPDQFESMTDAYETYGFAYCFTQTVVDRGIEMPENYSDKGIKAILSILRAKNKETAPAEEIPNLIFLQLESFFDLNAVQGVQLSDDPTPFFNELKQKYPSGFLTVPSIGGGTANTEFEVLTGMALDFFGIGEYPYNTILQEQTMPSLAYLMKEHGYSAQAFHNHEGSFYNRDQVYGNLGFDSFTSIEYMNGYNQNQLGWCTDSIFTEELLSAMQETDTKDFLFAVSVQCHGKYPTEYESPQNGITVSGISDPTLNAQYRYYADQLRQVDDFLRELTAALSAQKEPVILVLYGDHLPSLSITDENLPAGQTPYQTEYVIWSNTLPLSNVRENLESYQLAAYALSFAGVHDGALVSLHQTSRGRDYYRTWLHALQYDAVYGNAVSTDGFYPPSDLSMGRFPITVTSVTQNGRDLYISGEHFTRHSTVYLNGWKKETVFLSDTLLLVENTMIDDNDQIYIAQISDSGTLLSKTDTILPNSNVLALPTSFKRRQPL